MNDNPSILFVEALPRRKQKQPAVRSGAGCRSTVQSLNKVLSVELRSAVTAWKEMLSGAVGLQGRVTEQCSLRKPQCQCLDETFHWAVSFAGIATSAMCTGPLPLELVDIADALLASVSNSGLPRSGASKGSSGIKNISGLLLLTT